MEKQQISVADRFESLWRWLPAAYSQELKDLYLNVYEAGFRDGNTAQLDSPNKWLTSK